MKCRNVCHWTTVIAGMLIGAGACLQDHVQADLLAVNWGGNYVNGGPRLQFDPGDGDSGGDEYPDPDSAPGPYSYVAPIIPPGPGIDTKLAGRLVDDSQFAPLTTYNPAAPGYDINASSAVFYGGHVVAWDSNAPPPRDVNYGLTNLSVTNQALDDAIEIEIKPKGESVGYASLIYWDSDDFIDGIVIPDLSNITLALRITQAAADNPDIDPDQAYTDGLRWVVRNGDDHFFISETAVDVDPNLALGIRSGDLLLLDWYTYSPVGSLSDIFARGTILPDLSALTNITALGFYLESGNTDKGVDIKIKGFKATFAQVPEPSFAMVGLFGVGLFAVRRLRSRRSQSSAISIEQSPTV